MAKIFHLTLILEVSEDAPHPEEWDWHEHLLGNVPGLDGFSLIDCIQRPYSRMEDDPAAHAKH